MFKETLENIMERTEGSLGALIMGIDGIAVERLLKDAGQEANLDIAAAEFTSLVRNGVRIQVIWKADGDLDHVHAGIGQT